MKPNKNNKPLRQKKSELQAHAATKAWDILGSVLFEALVKKRKIALHVSNALTEEKRCCWGSITDVCCWQCRLWDFYILASPLYSRSQTLMLTYAILMLHLVVLSRGLCPAGSVWLVLLCKNQRFLLCAVFVQRKTIFMTMFIPRVGTSLVSVANTLSPVLEQWWVHVHLLFLWKPINKERGVK